MLLENLQSIVVRNYTSLVDEAGRFAKTRVALSFGFVPIVIGVLLGYYSPLWAKIVGALISAIGVLTGFSINSIVLLTSHSKENSYHLKTKHVNQTKDFTLYSILVGLVLLAALIIGYAGTSAEIQFSSIQNWKKPITTIPILSIVIYTLLCHYFMVLLSVTHRLYTLVHSDAIG
jgi:hypothetical protein